MRGTMSTDGREETEGRGSRRYAHGRISSWNGQKRSETVRNGQKRSRVDEKGSTHQNEPSSPVPRRLFHMN